MIVGFYKSYNVYDDRLLFDYKDNVLAEQSIFIPNSNTVYIGWESDLRDINSFMVGLAYKINRIKDDRYTFTYNQTYRPQHNIKISFDYSYKYGYKKYHWLETITDDSDNLHHIFSHKNHNEQKYTNNYNKTQVSKLIKKDLSALARECERQFCSLWLGRRD